VKIPIISGLIGFTNSPIRDLHRLDNLSIFLPECTRAMLGAHQGFAAAVLYSSLQALTFLNLSSQVGSSK
jgi:hypothetical protein